METGEREKGESNAGLSLVIFSPPMRGFVHNTHWHTPVLSTNEEWVFVLSPAMAVSSHVIWRFSCWRASACDKTVVSSHIKRFPRSMFHPDMTWVVERALKNSFLSDLSKWSACPSVCNQTRTETLTVHVYCSMKSDRWRFYYLTINNICSRKVGLLLFVLASV